MRRIVILTLLTLLCLASTANARLFWQTYGSVVSSGDGCGCTWNWNQDYFVPRHADSCRYGLFSPCKTSCTSSPACKWCHPIYQGYCSPYGPCHYCRKNCVYGVYCGCGPLCVDGPYRSRCCCLGLYGRHHCRPGGSCFCGKGCYRHGCHRHGCCQKGGCGRGGCCVPYRNGCGPESCESTGICSQGMCREGMCIPEAKTVYPLPNVEPPVFEVLGSIPDESDSLLAGAGVAPLEGGDEQKVLLSPQGMDFQQILPALGLPTKE